LKLNLDVTELSMAPVRQPCELIAISAASSSYNNYGIKEALDESVERRRVTMNNAKPLNGYTTEYYIDGSAVSTSQCFLGHRGCEGRKCFLASFSPQETSLNADTIDPFHSVFPIQLDSKMRSLVHYRE
jgi:hypothetical protein